MKPNIKGSFFLPVLVALLAGAADAASDQFTAVHTFDCNGSQFERTGSCPQGGRPDDEPAGLVVASDGTFYGLSFSTTLGEILFHYTESSGAFQSFPINFPSFNGLPSSGSLLTLGPNGNFLRRVRDLWRIGSGCFRGPAGRQQSAAFPLLHQSRRSWRPADHDSRQ